MRAATLIVAAIASASILIAISFIVSGGGSSKDVTRTVTEKIVGAPRSATEEPPGAEGVAAGSGGPAPCGGGEFTVENTNCEVGEQVHSDYERGHRGQLLAKDAETGATLTFLCKDDTEPITCTGEEGGVVYFGG